MWLGTDKVFDAFKFHVRETPYGVMQIHGYPFDAHRHHVHRRDDQRRLAARRLRRATPTATWAPGESDEKSIALVRELFADVLDGHEVMANNSRWISFTTVRNEHWATTTSCSSATPPTPRTSRSAPAPSSRWRTPSRWPPACTRSRPWTQALDGVRGRSARPVVLSTQRAAQASLEWFENLGQYVHQEPTQFAFNIMTRSAAGHLRQPAGARPGVRRAAATPGSPTTSGRRARPGDVRPPMFQPFRARRGLDPAQPGRSSRRWTCTSPRTACPATSTSCTSAARRSAAPAW